MDVDISDNPKLQKMEEKFGDKGFCFVTKLFAAIYKEGYYWDCDPDNIEEFCSRRLKATMDQFSDMLTEAIKLKIFSGYLYETYNIISSANVQRRYLAMTKTKKWSRVTIVDDYLLKEVNVDPYRIFICNQAGQIKFEKPPVEIPTAKIYEAKPKKSKPEVNPENIPVILEAGNTKPPENKKTEVNPPIQSLNGYDNGMLPTDEIRRFCALNYDTQNDLFKNGVNKSWFTSYVKFNQIIDEEYKQIRNSNYQLSLQQYQKLIKDPIDGRKVTEDEIYDAIEKLAGNGVQLDFVIFFKLKSYVQHLRNDKAKVNGNSVYTNATVTTGHKIDHSGMPTGPSKR